MKAPDGVSYWLVGAYYNDSNVDMAPEFIEKGIWTNGYSDHYLDLVRSMNIGDRIAIKSTYVQKNDLPFENHRLPVSVMAIKAVGTITENMGDGMHLRVDWAPVLQVKKWYFYTYQKNSLEIDKRC